MNKRDIVDLTADERAGLLALLHKGVAPARKLTRARILLRADEGGTDRETAATLHVHPATVERTRRRFVEGGVERALSDRPRPGGRPKLDGKQEAFLVALACSTPPEGRSHWTMQLLADRLVALGLVEAISDETVRRALKKHAEAVAEEAVVHRRGGRRLRPADGGRARPLCRAVRSPPAGGLF